MACSDMTTRTATQCFSKFLGIVIKVLNFVWMTYRCTYIITDWLPRDSGPDSSHVSRPQMIIINDYSMKMIKTNQNLLLGWEKFEKNFERISSHHWSNMSNVSYKVRINRINIVRALLLLSMSKKLRKPWEQDWVKTKLLELKHLLDKKIAKWKTILNQGTLFSYENLPIKSHLKKTCSLSCV